MMLSLILLLTQQLIRGVFIGSQFARTMIDRERAEMLALGGITIAIAQLTPTLREEERKEYAKQEGLKEEEAANVDENVLLLKRVLPYLNRWHDFALKEKIDGIDGLIKVCIVCEQGKINLNEAFDFKASSFKPEYESMLKSLQVPNIMKPGELYTKLLEFFQKRKRKLDDLSELLAIPGFDALDMYYQPPLPVIKGKKVEPNSVVTLQDLFTIWSSNDQIDPLWLSDALCAIIGVRRPRAGDAMTHQDRYQQFFKEFKKELAQDWDANWKVLEPLYDQKPKIVPDIKNIFTKEFGPRVFSVLSCGNVGRVEQKVLAIIRYSTRQDNAKKPQEGDEQAEKKEQEEDSVPLSAFKILRVYWL